MKRAGLPATFLAGRVGLGDSGPDRRTGVLELRSQRETHARGCPPLSGLRMTQEACAACPLTDEQETNSAAFRSVVFKSQSDPERNWGTRRRLNARRQSRPVRRELPS